VEAAEDCRRQKRLRGEKGEAVFGKVDEKNSRAPQKRGKSKRQNGAVVKLETVLAKTGK